ncbi:poly-gamma-glutamate synthase PgsB [bacterium]|nr:poly-gamma-glutamate synthase PgsB [bacterium]MBU1881522.1 poly-gamma-glutamate synthase PgsB [bacterium]
MLVILLLTCALILYGIWEFSAHQRNIRSIPIRIHVNGTRGKSSVTRLIAATLRSGGLRTYAKTTGTLPRVIDEKGLEMPVLRPTYIPNIIEQVKIIDYIHKHKPDAMVIECMAVQPEYQWICEHRMVKATIGVITNARPDHLREMGPSMENVTRSLLNTLPDGGIAFTAEKRMFPLMKQEADRKHVAIIQIPKESVTDEMMHGFSYLEHRENVAVALAVAKHLDISAEKALQGMYQSHPDAGALRMYKVGDKGKEVRFINALAANDPESSLSVWQKVRRLYSQDVTVIVLLNTRADRFDRSIQLLEMIGNHIKYDHIISIGEKTAMLAHHYRHCNINKSKVVDMGLTRTESVYHKVIDLTKEKALILAVGNMGAGGLAVANVFRDRAKQQEKENRSG